MIEHAIHYQIDNAPVRIAGSEPPYTLINASLNNTIWLADNAGIEVGQGTPLHPGTSLMWTRSGQFYAISASAAVMVMSNVEDWEPDPAAIATAILNSGVILVDQPVMLFTGDLFAGNGFSTPKLDISTYQSVTIVAQVTALSSGNQDTLTMGFFVDIDDPLPFNFRVVSFTGLGSNAGGVAGGDWIASIPVSGAAIQFQSGTQTSIRLTVVGSHRPQESIEQAIWNSHGILGEQPETDFYFAVHELLNTQSFFVDTNPWMGEIDISAFVNAKTVPGTSRLLVAKRLVSDGLFRGFQQAGFAASAGRDLLASLRISSAGDAYRVFVVNGSGSDWIGGSPITLKITPVSGYGQVA